MQDELIIEAHVANEVFLIGSLSDQNDAIQRLKDMSDDQEETIRQAENQSEKVRNEYDKVIRELLVDKPSEVVTCEDNMTWMVEKAPEFKWKF